MVVYIFMSICNNIKAIFNKILDIKWWEHEELPYRKFILHASETVCFILADNVILSD